MKTTTHRFSFALFCAAGLAAAVLTPTALGQQGGKISVKTADDLPRHTYQITGKASEFLVAGESFDKLVAQVRTDLEADLAGYSIEDPNTLQGFYQTLQAISILQGRDSDALEYVEKSRALEAKEAKKLMMGLVLKAMIDGKAAAKQDPKAFDAAFNTSLDSAVRALPWQVVRDEVIQAKARTEIISRELIMGQVKGQLDPVIETQKGEISQDIARGLVSTRMTMDTLLPLMPKVGATYSKIIAENTVAKTDIWAARSVTLEETAEATPVVVCIWDSGVDTSLFPTQLWTSKAETVNGKDDDNNGFVDDVHGIAYDLDARPVPELLHGTTEFQNDLALVTDHMKGYGDVQANVESPEATAIKGYMKNLKADQVKPFMEDLGLFGNYSHGTHVAGIAAEGNPFARILAARITFDYRMIPKDAPSLERAKQEAKGAADSINYMKAAGVRVVNMSWGGSRADVESALETKGVGKDAAERAAMAREFFGIQKDALEKAMASAPEILFVAAAGNSDNNVEFSEMIPSGIKLPNLITVGAVDQAGKPTGFTSFGQGVGLYANGFEVESYIPGGRKLKFSGTSMAAPNVTNLAAKLIALNPSLTVAQTIELIKAGGEPMEGGDSSRLVINPQASIELLDKR